MTSTTQYTNKTPAPPHSHTPLNLDLDDVERPHNNLWIIPADDADLDLRLIQAIVLGISLVITHMERKRIGARFNHLVARNVIYDGKRRVIVIGGAEYEYNPRFKLYLCSSVPLEMIGML